MGAFRNINSQEYFKRYGYKYGILRGLFTKWPLHIVSDYENKKILYYRKARKWLERKYLAYSQRDPEGLQFGTIACENPVWIYWKQGIENAPDIVKVCIQSIKENSENEVILITEKNMADYVSFPAYILKKVSNENMSAAAFSDLLRFTLLEHFGGTWIDATVYLTGALPEYITGSEFFAYQDVFGMIKNPALISNWLLHCKQKNIVMKETRNMAFAYWERESYVIEYLFTYIFLTISLENHPEVKRDMPYANSDYSYLMLNNLDEKYDYVKGKHIETLTSVHKLTYKLHAYVYRDEENFYHHIIQEGTL